MNIKCKETWDTGFNENILTENKIYEFIRVDNRYTRVIMKEYDFVGYIKKDDEGEKRWVSREFKNTYFDEVSPC